MPGVQDGLPGGDSHMPDDQDGLPGWQESLPGGGGSHMPGETDFHMTRTDDEPKRLFKKQLLKDVLEAELHNYQMYGVSGDLLASSMPSNKALRHSLLVQPRDVGKLAVQELATELGRQGRHKLSSEGRKKLGRNAVSLARANTVKQGKLMTLAASVLALATESAPAPAPARAARELGPGGPPSWRPLASYSYYQDRAKRLKSERLQKEAELREDTKQKAKKARRKAYRELRAARIAAREDARFQVAVDGESLATGFEGDPGAGAYNIYVAGSYIPPKTRAPEEQPDL
eukprot:gene7993-1219_t